MPMQRGASLTTSEHIDPASPPAQLAEMEDPDSADIPEGAVRFNVTAQDIAAAIAEESLEVGVPCVLAFAHPHQLRKACEHMPGRRPVSLHHSQVSITMFANMKDQARVITTQNAGCAECVLSL